MTAEQQYTKMADGTFNWPASEPPHSENLALASKLCTALLPRVSNAQIITKHLPSGWSSNDVIQVTTSSIAQQRRFIVKLPRRQTSSCVAASCRAEAIRTDWAATRGFGPRVLATDDESGGFVMDFVEGRTLTTELLRQRLPQAVSLIRRIHNAEVTDWMRMYDPIEVVKQQLEKLMKRKTMQTKDIRLIKVVLHDVAENVKGHPWMPCHNDFHSHNVMLRRASGHKPERLLAIDFEDCNLGDPMWDLAYLAVNLEMEQETYSLACLYHATAEDERRMRAYIPLAMAHCATWTALHGEAWGQHHEEVMERLKEMLAI
ncbi:kinase-like domain-containing protein [Usnea florida]